MIAFGSFFAELDQAWPDAPLVLRVIGSTALMMQTSYQRGTKDSDVLETDTLTDEAQQRLLALAGPASTLRVRHRLYLEIVPSGLLFLPQQPIWHHLDLGLQRLRIEALDPLDVVISKCIRMNATDIADIEAMVDLGLVPHAVLIQRFKSAVDIFTLDARSGQLPRLIANLNRIERDMLLTDETRIDLPDWI